MVQFQINWTITDFKVSDFVNGRQYSSELKLNNNWKIICAWRENSNKNLKPYTIEFRRSYALDEVSISGTLYIKGSSSLERSELKFSEFMGPGSSKIYVKDPTPGHRTSTYCLKGVVNINSYTLGNEECTNCVNLLELSNDLGRLLDTETCCLTDVNLKCGDESIPAHKIILSARSPVFSTMFKTPMKESRENEVLISDIDVSIFRTMLVYMYTGKISNLTVPIASDLLIAADKYQLGDLKRMCCEFLKDNISVENVLKILFLGDLYCNDMKSCAIDYMCSVCTEFSVLEKTDEWETMRKERSDLAMDILSSVVKAREKKD